MIVTLWLLRATLLLHAALAVAQPVMAGAYLGGDYDMLSAHGANGSFVAFLALAAIVASAVHALARGPRWPVLVTLLLFVGETVQIIVGYAGTLAIHIPLGVAIVTTAVVMAGWSFTKSASRRRSRRRERQAARAAVAAG